MGTVMTLPPTPSALAITPISVPITPVLPRPSKRVTLSSRIMKPRRNTQSRIVTAR